MISDLNNHLKSIVQALPDSPGVYKYFDSTGKIIYVGKAKSLKKRVSSYFVGTKEYGKIKYLVKSITDIQTILTDTELDALLLENTLIKKYQPKYNVSLKDDKSYPYIVITTEAFPRVFSIRKKIKGLGTYYGPFASGKTLHTLLDLFRNLFHIRTCKLNLSPQQIASDKYKVCLEYHLKKCFGPCAKLQTEPDYLLEVNAIRNIIKGNLSDVLKQLKLGMQESVANLEFEKAQLYKENIDVLSNYQSKSTVVNPAISNIDVFSYDEDETTAFINYMCVVNGAIINSRTIELKRKLEESKQDLLLMGVIELRERYESNAREVIVPFAPEMELENIHFTIPQKGDKKSLLDLSLKNLVYYKQEKYRQDSLVDPERNSNRILETMKKDLRLKQVPARIECFDNSNFQGTNAVAAMTVFINAKPAKKEYRHFNIKTVTGPDDFASMEEIIYRRYSKIINEGLDMPDLIVIDGGKGQLSAAMTSLGKLDLIGKVAVIGIAKKLEEIFYPEDSIPLYLDKRSETLKIIQQIRDEAHRFGITHHRNKRDKATLQTELTAIEGVSDKTAQKLLEHFKSVSKIKKATLEELVAVIGNDKGNKVFGYFKP